MVVCRSRCDRRSGSFPHLLFGHAAVDAALVSISVVTAISFWNDYTSPAVYYPDHPTLAFGINTLLNDVRRSSSSDFGSNYPLMFACILVAVVPIVIFFACFQKTIMKNMAVGGLKG